MSKPAIGHMPFPGHRTQEQVRHHEILRGKGVSPAQISRMEAFGVDLRTICDA